MAVDLPSSVLALAKFTPVEDFLLTILKSDLVDVPTYSLIPDEVPPFFNLVRRLPNLGPWNGDRRFIDSGRFFVHTFASDPDGDEKAAIIAEATRVVLDAASEEKRMFPGKGSLIRIDMDAEPVRKTDWATSSGPVQFADLPTGYWRYETIYGISIRLPF